MKENRRKALQLYNMALELAKEGRLDEAIDALKRSLSHDPYHVNTYNLLGKVYIRKGEFRRAKSSWKSALKLDPLNSTAISCLNALKSYGLLSRFKDHIALITAAIAIIVALIALLLRG
ncbi:TPA: tetratricopeptide repeat protein [Candidatus Poribacteria bacterium]|nr:tetratricopeptide repeat protein [Candidatus Poribacteria bacterium]